MTNNTINLSRELVQSCERELRRHATPGARNRAEDLRIALGEPESCGACQACQGGCRLERESPPALAEPVPPAGGEVEVLPQMKPRNPGYFFDLDLTEKLDDSVAKGWNAACDAWEPHITRLQAEVERLKTMSDNYCSLLMDANTELTKARDLLEHAEGTIGMSYDWQWLRDRISDHLSNKSAPASAEPSAPVAVVMPEKYDDVLLPFLSLMRAELHANSHKGDRPGWLQMDRKTAVLEVFYHMGKLHQAVHRDEAAAIKEYSADVANMCMMLTDVCGCLNSEQKP